MIFNKKDNAVGLAVCKYCNNKFSYKSTTGNLNSHLKRSHASIYLAKQTTINVESELIENTVPSTSTEANAVDVATASTSTGVVVNQMNENHPLMQPPRKRQRTMQAYTIKKITCDERKRIDRDLLELFISDYQPFRIVEDKGFKKFAKNIPGYTLPSRKTISTTMIPALYTDTLNKTKEIVSQDAMSVCLTTDCWTSSQTESYIGVTAHYIDSNFEPKQVLLECKSLNESHTSSNLARELKRVTDEWNLTQKVNFSISDNARNIVKAIETELEWKHYGCYAHSLNLIVTAALKPVEGLIDKIKNIVAHFKRSTSATDMLLSYQLKNMTDSGEPKRLVQQVPTRWNSTYYMLRRFTLLKEAVKHCMALIEKDWPEISVLDWETMAEICTVLQPFEEITSSISGDEYLTGSLVIVVTNCLKEVCDDFLNREEYRLLYPVVVDVITSLQRGLRERFSGVEHSKTFGLCTLLDPRFKLLCFKNEQAVAELKRHVHMLIIGIINKNQLTETNRIEQEKTVITGKVSAWDKFDELLQKNKPQGNAQARAIRELHMYLDDEMLPRKNSEGKWNSPSQWWRDHKIIYPHLSHLFRTKCNIVATSVPCERLFSKTGLIINDRRCRLKAKKVEQLAFLNANLSSFK